MQRTVWLTCAQFHGDEYPGDHNQESRRAPRSSSRQYLHGWRMSMMMMFWPEAAEPKSPGTRAYQLPGCDAHQAVSSQDITSCLGNPNVYLLPVSWARYNINPDTNEVILVFRLCSRVPSRCCLWYGYQVTLWNWINVRTEFAEGCRRLGYETSPLLTLLTRCFPDYPLSLSLSLSPYYTSIPANNNNRCYQSLKNRRVRDASTI